MNAPLLLGLAASSPTKKANLERLVLGHVCRRNGMFNNECRAVNLGARSMHLEGYADRPVQSPKLADQVVTNALCPAWNFEFLWYYDTCLTARHQSHPANSG